MSAVHTFRRYERLKSRRNIQELFEKGKSIFLFPVRVYYLPCDPGSLCNHQVLIGASKKTLRRAVDRNFVKRRLRESYRLHKSLLGNGPVYFKIGYIYVGKRDSTTMNFKTLQACVVASLTHLQAHYCHSKGQGLI